MNVWPDPQALVVALENGAIDIASPVSPLETKRLSGIARYELTPDKLGLVFDVAMNTTTSRLMTSECTWRRFLKSPAQVRITEDEVVVELPRRAHNPILIASGPLEEHAQVPWWAGRTLRFEIP